MIITDPRAMLAPPPPMLALPAVVPARLPLDCVVVSDALAFLRGLPDASVDMILTSPPYDNLRRYKGFSWDFEGIALEAYRVLKPGGVMVWVVGDATIHGSETLSSMRQAIYFVDCAQFWMHDTMIWDKNATVFPDVNRYYQVFEYMFVLSKGKPRVANLLKQPNNWAGQTANTSRRINNDNLGFNPNAVGRVVALEGVMKNLWRIDVGFSKSTKDIEAYQHPAIFPEELARRHILSWSNPGDVVLDFFAGSGTTLKVARNLNRHYIGCDISAEYVAIARERLRMPFEPHHVIKETKLDDLPLFAQGVSHD